jgi:FkbM family methyltransferase
MISHAVAWGTHAMSIDQRPLHALAGRTANPPNWRQRLRTHIVSRGIKVMCGRSDDVTSAATTDIPLLSAAARLAWLKALAAVGVKEFVTTSGLGYDFVCHTGDLANFPFYYRNAYRTELALCAAWLKGVERPVVYDIGANGGFVATHLAQMLAPRAARIYAFEPVPTTFAMLAQSVERLGLKDTVHPVAAAVVDTPGPVSISYSEQNSLLAQVSSRGLNPRAGNKLARVEGITLDAFHASVGAFPDLLKIDVEGSEAAVLRGAHGLISRPDRPAILFEYNPTTMSESGASAGSLRDLLAGYALHYVDDLRGQAIPLGGPVRDLEAIDWICNLFALPFGDDSGRRWASVLQGL